MINNNNTKIPWQHQIDKYYCCILKIPYTQRWYAIYQEKNRYHIDVWKHGLKWYLCSTNTLAEAKSIIIDQITYFQLYNCSDWSHHSCLVCIRKRPLQWMHACINEETT